MACETKHRTWREGKGTVDQSLVGSKGKGGSFLLLFLGGWVMRVLVPITRRARTKEWPRAQDAAHRACEELCLHPALKLKCARRFEQTPHVRRPGRRSFDNSSSRRARTKELLRAQDAAHRACKKLCLRPALKLKCAFFSVLNKSRFF